MPATDGGKAGRRVLRIGLLAVLGLAALFLLLEQNLSRTMLDLSYAQAYALAVETVNRAVAETMRDVDYDDLVMLRTDAEGCVTVLSSDSVRMNELATQTALLAQSRLDAAENQFVEIPLGSALGVKFLAGSGPRIPVQIIPVGSVNTQFETEFESAGINQTRHKISLRLKTTVRLIALNGSQRVDVLSTVPIAESIIVGKVPDSFVDVANQDDMLNLIP